MRFLLLIGMLLAAPLAIGGPFLATQIDLSEGEGDIGIGWHKDRVGAAIYWNPTATRGNEDPGISVYGFLKEFNGEVGFLNPYTRIAFDLKTGDQSIWAGNYFFEIADVVGTAAEFGAYLNEKPEARVWVVYKFD